jgi:hypothetical protein
MKSSELRQLIKEEIRKVISEVKQKERKLKPGEVGRIETLVNKLKKENPYFDPYEEFAFYIDYVLDDGTHVRHGTTSTNLKDLSNHEVPWTTSVPKTTKIGQMNTAPNYKKFMDYQTNVLKKPNYFDKPKT